jgi:hypothetical protein
MSVPITIAIPKSHKSAVARRPIFLCSVVIKTTSSANRTGGIYDVIEPNFSGFDNWKYLKLPLIDDSKWQACER